MRSFTLIDFVSLFAALRWTVALVVLALAFGAPLALAFAKGPHQPLRRPALDDGGVHPDRPKRAAARAAVLLLFRHADVPGHPGAGPRCRDRPPTRSTPRPSSARSGVAGWKP
ncbi:hypothetical protein ABIF63_006591 [Bradyrhizobium japonicum]|uniref:Uncharacterized protein n=1 Tax=Bradyrhizobium japonicum TaxID=375 RepID=A0ABV2S1M9_BRAJP